MTEIIQLPEEIVSAISKPLPPEALKPHPTRSYLSTINAAYLMQRLDDIFGIGGWNISDNGITWIQDSKGKQYACTKVTLTLTEYNISFNAYGGSNNDDPGDMMKGAVTDGFTSCCKQLGVGRHVWMDKKGQQQTSNYERGNGGSAQRPAAAAKPAPVKAAMTPAQKDAIAFLENYQIRTVQDLNDALMGAKKTEMSKDTKAAVWSLLKARAVALKAVYDEGESKFA